MKKATSKIEAIEERGLLIINCAKYVLINSYLSNTLTSDYYSTMLIPKRIEESLSGSVIKMKVIPEDSHL